MSPTTTTWAGQRRGASGSTCASGVTRGCQAWPEDSRRGARRCALRWDRGKHSPRRVRRRCPAGAPVGTAPPERAMTLATDQLDRLAIDTIRTLSIDGVQQANSGHPGAPMGAAPMAYALWTRYLRHDPRDPDWPDRDRFVLSGGHGSALLYSLLNLTGYALRCLASSRGFRQWGSKTPGHPESTASRPASRLPRVRSGRGSGMPSGWRSRSAGSLIATIGPARDRRSLDVRDRLRRRPDGGRGARGQRDRWFPASSVA